MTRRKFLASSAAAIAGASMLPRAAETRPARIPDYHGDILVAHGPLTITLPSGGYPFPVAIVAKTYDTTVVDGEARHTVRKGEFVVIHPCNQWSVIEKIGHA